MFQVKKWNTDIQHLKRQIEWITEIKIGPMAKAFRNYLVTLQVTPIGLV